MSKIVHKPFSLIIETSIINPSTIKTSAFFLLAAVAFSAGAASGQKVAVTSSLGPGGLTSLKFGDVVLLADPGSGTIQPANNTPRFVRKDSSQYTGSDHPLSQRLDSASQTIRQVYPWGEIRCAYRQEAHRLTLRGAVTNRAPADSLDILTLRIAEFDFPQIPLGNIPDPGQFGTGKSHPLHQYPLLAPADVMPPAVEVNFGDGILAFCSEDLGTSAVISIPLTTNPPRNTRYPLWLTLRRIPPGETRKFNISLRFGPAGSYARTLAADIYQRFAAVYPFRLQWADRRPIGTNFLASLGNHPPKNPRGWFNNAADVDVTTDAGREAFRARLLQYADDSIKVLHQMKAQGVITWDPEGQESGAAAYYGDPRLVSRVAPEMEYRGNAPLAAVDAYFKRFRDAGLRVGVCIRPQQIRFVNGAPVQEGADDPEQVLADKIAAARRRWGCTLFYVDSTVHAKGEPLDAAIFEKLAAANPDVLLIPENQTYREYAVTAPLDSFFHHGVTGTSSDVRAAYPGAFTVLLGPGGGPSGSTGSHREGLITGLKQGDILTFRAWYNDPENAPIQALYNSIGAGPEARMTSPLPGASLRAGSSLTIAAAVTPGRYPIRMVEFFRTGAALGQLRVGQATRLPYQCTWRNVPRGRWVLTARITDSGGSVRVPASRVVQVR